MGFNPGDPLQELPIPPHYDPSQVGAVWRVPYEEIALQARHWKQENHMHPAGEDRQKIYLLLIDVQNTFCIPDFELFVGGRSGTGAIDDNRRLCEFIYRNLAKLSKICATLDTHHAAQIFHAAFLLDENGIPPQPYTQVSAEDIRNGKLRINPAIASTLGVGETYGKKILQHYTDRLLAAGKYGLTIWPYHALLGGIGHALVASVEEAVFFHTIAREIQPEFLLKGDEAFTEHYSALGPEIDRGPSGEVLGEKNRLLTDLLEESDALIIAGQAKSHCVAWTVSDLLEVVSTWEPPAAEKIYLLEDCSSPVVVPGVVDFTDQAAEAYRRFADTGVNVVRSTVPMADWPGLQPAG